ncbi:hypothetical protein Q3G72_019120 [Acer saccharum]|nr:hypothetical protein Q3G72_019120 [Acer saccharum]
MGGMGNRSVESMQREYTGRGAGARVPHEGGFECGRHVQLWQKNWLVVTYAAASPCISISWGPLQSRFLLQTAATHAPSTSVLAQSRPFMTEEPPLKAKSRS